MRGLGIGAGGAAEYIRIAQVPLQQVYNHVLAADVAGADAILVSCTDFATLEALPKLEAALAENREGIRRRIASADGLQRSADEDDVTLTLETPSEIGTVIADPFRLRQVMMNVMGNALKFTPRGGQVTIRAAVDADGVSPRWVEIQDTGIGISKERLDRIFDPFEQGDASTTRAFGGTGLGLTISRRLCTLMGMSIIVTSELGEGSKFRIVFPSELMPAQ